MPTRASTLVIGALSAVMMSYTALALIPGFQLSTVEATPERIEYTAAQARGRLVYQREGCLYCHTQQVRAEGFGVDQARGWGSRGSLPGDYVYDDPPLLGSMRTGQDLHDIGHRVPSLEWHLTHLYQPRALVAGSLMPAYPYLFEVRDPADVLPSEVTVALPRQYQPGDGKVVVATRDALDLVAYLQSLRVSPVLQADGVTAPTVN